MKEGIPIITDFFNFLRVLMHRLAEFGYAASQTSVALREVTIESKFGDSMFPKVPTKSIDGVDA